MNTNEVILRLIVTLTKIRLIGNEHGKFSFTFCNGHHLQGAQYQNTQTEQTVTITVDYFPRFLYSCQKLNKWIHATLELVQCTDYNEVYSSQSQCDVLKD